MCKYLLNGDDDGVGMTLTTAHHFAGNIMYPRQGYREMGVLVIMSCNPISRISNSQNGVVYYPSGISSCICSGGNGHDASYPYIAEVWKI